MTSRFFSAATLAAGLVATTGCGQLVMKAYGIDPAQHRVPAANPIVSGEPLSFGYEKLTSCGLDAEGQGFRLKAAADEICIEERVVVKAPLADGRPAPASAWTRKVKSDGGETASFELKAKGEAQRAGTCTDAKSTMRVWVTEYSGCTPNGGVLTDHSTFAAIWDETPSAGSPVAENIGWTFAKNGAEASKTK